MFYMLMILMKFSFVPQTFFRIRISRWNSLRGYIQLCSRKKGIFTIFHFGKTTQFWKKTERLFIFTCRKVFYEFFQKKIFITGVTIAIVPKHNFPDISRGEHVKEGTAYLKYTKQNKTVVCTFTLWVNEGFLISSKTFFFLLQKRKAQTFKNQTFLKNDHHFCKKVNSAKSFVNSEREGTNYSFFCFVYFR